MFLKHSGTAIAGVVLCADTTGAASTLIPNQLGRPRRDGKNFTLGITRRSQITDTRRKTNRIRNRNKSKATETKAQSANAPSLTSSPLSRNESTFTPFGRVRQDFDFCVIPHPATD